MLVLVKWRFNFAPAKNCSDQWWLLNQELHLPQCGVTLCLNQPQFEQHIDLPRGRSAIELITCMSAVSASSPRSPARYGQKGGGYCNWQAGAVSMRQERVEEGGLGLAGAPLPAGPCPCPCRWVAPPSPSSWHPSAQQPAARSRSPLSLPLL